jgi:Tfp pilus assembly protein PilN
MKTKDQSQKLTRALPGIPKKPGRPFTGKAQSNAERQAAYRKRQAALRETALWSSENVYGKDSMETLKKLIVEGGPITFEGAWREIGRRKGWLR